MVDPLAPREVSRAGLCIGCGSCASGKPALGWDGYGQLKPEGEWTREKSDSFTRICPFSPAARNEDGIAAERFPAAPVQDGRIGRFEDAYVGHVAEAEWRAGGSSGGMVSWVAAELIAQDLVDAVAHVAPTDLVAGGRFFGYRLSRSVDEVRTGAKSRYYPVEMSAVLDEIRRTPGRYAVVGVPCFIKAVHLARAEDPILAERITHTLGLFCGHMKSARLVESFAWQLGAPIEEVRAVEYRQKNADRPANWYTAHLTLADGSARWQDWMHLADGDWGAGFFQNNACNYCDDVVAETADIAFGDAWVEPYSSDGRGTNVVIVRSPELRDRLAGAITAGRLELKSVGADFIADTQAAGLRHRREGLAYRLRVHPPKLPLRKRVAPGGEGLSWRRKRVYRMRRRISGRSHWLFALARLTGWHRFYTGWARTALYLYQALAWGHGRLGKLLDRLEGKSRDA